MTDAADRLGRRASLDPHFLAFALKEFAESERLAEDALAGFLKTTLEGLARLRLCPAPRPDDEHFAADVDRLAAKFELDRDALARIAKFGLVLSEVRPDPDASGSETVAPFLAARDAKQP